jgi:FkbM family methyltransferase
MLKILLVIVAGNRFSQNILERVVRSCQYLMGIGAGSEVDSSGEKVLFNVLKKKCSAPYCIFDVGSNKGQYLNLILDNMPSDNFSVHCFEPGRETFGCLTESIGEDQRIRLNNLGLGKSKTKAILHYDIAGSGLASLTKRKLEHFDIDFEHYEKVELNTLDGYCLENSIRHIDLLKIDVEGHELDVLMGAEQLLAAKSVDIITFEFGGCNIDTRTFFQDFWYFFLERHFRIYRITPSGYLHPVDSYKELHEQFRTINFVAVLDR